MADPIISGVPTSVAGFVGAATNGPVNEAVRCNSSAEYETAFGAPGDGDLGHAVRPFFLNGGADAIVVRAEDESAESLRAAFGALDTVDLNILCFPGLWNLGVFREAMEYCRARRAFLLIDGPRTAAPGELASLAQTDALPRGDSSALYYPWILVPGADSANKPRLTAPSGAVAGVYARTDGNRGVWNAPAGLDARLIDAQGTGYVLDDREHDMLNPLGVNCIRVFANGGTVIWGARTLAGLDGTASEWNYISVRRTAIFIEHSVSAGLQWTVFEPNGERLWQRIRNIVGRFMHGLFLQGAFRGQTADEAYFVKCDNATTTQDDINSGVVNIEIGFAALKPAEFVVINLRQLAARSDSDTDEGRER